MSDAKFPKYLKRLLHGRKGSTDNSSSGDGPGAAKEEVLQPCCQGKVHIAYRGVSDERLYLSKDRAFNELKFFRPNGLRVFCADCRRRMV